MNIKSIKSKEYPTSLSEMNRRKLAFLTFLVSISITMGIFSRNVIMEIPEIFVPILILFVLVELILIVKLNKTLDKQSHLKIVLTESELQWKYIDTVDCYCLNDIKSMRIKRTSKGTLREIRIGFEGMKFRYINGLDNFEEFIGVLTNKVESERQSNFKEAVDFDHPLFYVILGGIIGTITSLSFKLLFFISDFNIRFVKAGIIAYLIFTALFIFINKPIRGRYGNKVVLADYIFSLIILIISVVIFFLL